LHELFSYNLYPGPSAKKGIYGVLLGLGEREGGVTNHCSTVQVVTPYDNVVTIMHEGASGGGKSEMLEQAHREPDGRLLLGENLMTGERRYLEPPRHHPAQCLSQRGGGSGHGGHSQFRRAHAPLHEGEAHLRHPGPLSHSAAGTGLAVAAGFATRARQSEHRGHRGNDQRRRWLLLAVCDGASGGSSQPVAPPVYGEHPHAPHPLSQPAYRRVASGLYAAMDRARVSGPARRGEVPPGATAPGALPVTRSHTASIAGR